MDKKQLFSRYYTRLAIEGIIKSLVFGFLAGLAVGFAVSLTTFLMNLNGQGITMIKYLSITIPLFVFVAAAVTTLFYFFRYRPNTAAIARRIDRLGLDERLVTMLELEKDQSFMAMRQREDAKQRLAEFKEDRLKYTFLKLPFIILACVAVLCISMVVLTVINSGDEPIWGKAPERDPDTVSAVYEAGPGGFILGETDQIIRFGKDGSEVYAIEDEWFVFDQWSDGVTTPYRQDFALMQDLHVTANFIALIEGETETALEGDPNKPNPDAEPQPGTPIEPPDDEDDPPPPPPEGTPDGSGQEGRDKVTVSDTVDDGKTHYGDVIQSNMDRNLDEIASNRDIPDEMREMAESYYNSINKTKPPSDSTTNPLPTLP